MSYEYINWNSAETSSLNRLPICGRYRAFNLLCNAVFCAVGLPLVAFFAILLLVLNPFLNPGPLFYRQARMGRNGTSFMMWKFRTMTPAAGNAVRAHDAPLEESRITRLGRVLRKTRIDELPNFINVARGEMSVVGPRPDAWDHSAAYVQMVSRYRDRFAVLPGITGLAQVRGGYADTGDAIRRKAAYDSYYVRRRSVMLDIYIILRTVTVMATGLGAK